MSDDAILFLRLTTRQIKFAQSLRLSAATSSDEAFETMRHAMRLAAEMMAAIQEGRSIPFLDALRDPGSADFGRYLLGPALCEDIRRVLPRAH